MNEIIKKSMIKPTKHYIFLWSFIFLSSCSNNLLLPLSKGKERIENNGDIRNIYLYPSSSALIKSSEDSKIENVLFIDSAYVILARGNYQILYGKLAKVFVKKGDSVSRGEVIGSLDSGHSGESFLLLSVLDVFGNPVKTKFSKY